MANGNSDRFFQESQLAHKYCVGKGLEIGGSAHNPFGLNTMNVDFTDAMDTEFKKEETTNCGQSLPVDIVANGDDIPLPDRSQDFIVSSHVLEHFPNPIKALIEWDRLIRPGGVIFMIVPHKDRTFDREQRRTPLQHLINDFIDDTRDFDAGRHYHFWVTEDIVQLVQWMIDSLDMQWELAELADTDDKVGNGFAVVVKKLRDRVNPINMTEFTKIMTPDDIKPATSNDSRNNRPCLSLSRIKSVATAISPAFLSALKEMFELDIFVETGTFMGDTSAAAAQIFREVHTIELSEELFKRAEKRFAQQQNIHLYKGDSPDILPAILPRLTGKVLFWLDGHYSECNTAKGEKNTPILEELKSISKSGKTDIIVLIDDLRCFQQESAKTPHSLSGYPTVSQLLHFIQDLFPGSDFLVFGDVGLIVTAACPMESSPLLRACTISRSFENTSGDYKEVLQAERTIGMASGEEKAALQALHTDFEESETHGLCSHYRLWNALILLHTGDFANACREFHRSLELGCNHWRIRWYLAQALAGAGKSQAALETLRLVLQEAPSFQPALEMERNLNQAVIQAGNSNRSIEIGTSGEQEIIRRFIAPGAAVFDIGANVGDWTSEVLRLHPDVTVHLFEPAPQTFQSLLQNLAEPLKSGKFFPNNCAIAHGEDIRTFYYYENSPSWSTFFRRYDIEKECSLPAPKEFPIFTTTLDDYCRRLDVKHINYLKIDVEGGELEVLHGANNLLKAGSIDYLQFEYGGTFSDAGVTLQQVFAYLQTFRYALFKILPTGLEYIPEFRPTDETFEYCNYLAANERFLSTILGEEPKMLDLQALCRRHGVIPRGVIHIGAHEGREMATYQNMGVQNVLFIEANPEVYKRLEQNISGLPGVGAVNCAVSDFDGDIILHVTSMDQSSSILPLKHHRDIYPDITETMKVSVPSRTLDTLLPELGMDTSLFNIINIDIQGAELLALRGAVKTLANIEAINTEINYNELYEGCALIDQIDAFLQENGFERKATVTPYHPSWGDAFYVRKPVITMSTLGSNGRFANQLFQYAFLKIYAKEHNLQVETPAWIGQQLFGLADPAISKSLPSVKEHASGPPEAELMQPWKICKNVDIWGYFQDARYFAPHKEYFCATFQPAAAIKQQLKPGLEALQRMGKNIIGLHVRRGDFGYGNFQITPYAWYHELLEFLWATVDQPVLFIASDDLPGVLPEFASYNPVTSSDLGMLMPEAPFYPDFHILSNCDIVALSNSSFGFAACLLNENLQRCYRPLLAKQRLVECNVWDATAILTEIAPYQFYKG